MINYLRARREVRRLNLLIAETELSIERSNAVPDIQEADRNYLKILERSLAEVESVRLISSVGTRSVLYGAHAFYLHPWFVAYAWWKLYGFPWDPRLWVAFFVHDLGYVGKPDMDGSQEGGGEWHPYWGACLMGALFGKKWFDFTLYHSRFLCKRLGGHPSKLCIADKLSIAITPAWLYLPMVNWTGEIDLYMELSAKREAGGEGGTQKHSQNYVSMQHNVTDQKLWYSNLQTYIREWVEAHKDGSPDTWTPEQKEAVDASGVWK